MGRQERLTTKRLCPRGCGRTLLAEHNAKSEVDGRQICPECKIDEFIKKWGDALEGENDCG